MSKWKRIATEVVGTDTHNLTINVDSLGEYAINNRNEGYTGLWRIFNSATPITKRYYVNGTYYSATRSPQNMTAISYDKGFYIHNGNYGEGTSLSKNWFYFINGSALQDPEFISWLEANAERGHSSWRHKLNSGVVTTSVEFDISGSVYSSEAGVAANRRNFIRIGTNLAERKIWVIFDDGTKYTYYSGPEALFITGGADENNPEFIQWVSSIFDRQD